MAFQIKNFVSIVASMINYMKSTQTEINDFAVGAVARTLVEAPAIEIDQLYQQAFIGLKEAIPVSTFNTFNFSALPAVAASGMVAVTIAQQAQDVTIAAGTVISYQGAPTGFATSADTTITAGNTSANVLVTAQTPGTLGNIPANQVFTTASPAPTGFVSATNTAAFTNGADAEMDDQRLLRFQSFIATLPRGTIAALEYGARTAALYDANGVLTERVATAGVVEPYVTDNTQPIALVDIYIHNGVGSTSGALVAQCQQVINGYTDSKGNKVPGWKAAGVPATVYAATEVPLNLSGVLTAELGYSSSDLIPLVKSAIDAYTLGIAIGDKFLASEAVALAMGVIGVSNFVLAPLPNLSAPAAPTLGSIAGGALGAATYYVKTTYVNINGETIGSSESNLAVAADNVLVVDSPKAEADASGWNVYISTGAGTETKQNASPIAIGTNWTMPATGLIAGAALPATNTAEATEVDSSSSEKLMPGTTTITATN